MPSPDKSNVSKRHIQTPIPEEKHRELKVLLAKNGLQMAPFVLDAVLEKMRRMKGDGDGSAA